MDNKRLILAALLTVALMLVWTPVVNWVGTKAGYDMSAKPLPAEVADETSPGGTAPATRPTTGPATGPAYAAGGAEMNPATAPAGLTARGAASPAPAMLGSLEKSDTLPRRPRPHPFGAGVQSVTLNRFTAEVDKPQPYVYQTGYPAARPPPRRWPRSPVTIDGRTADLTDVAWTLEHSDARSATYAATVASDAGDLLTVRKTFALTERDPKTDAGTRGYEVDVTTTFQNRTDAR